jgi:hypothetical protein
MSLRISVFAALPLAGCFAPQLQDGVIACGTAGCPTGMVCADDGLCYAPGAVRIALAVASNGGHSRMYAVCDGQLGLVWTDEEVRDARALDWGDADGDGFPELALATDDGALMLFAFTDGQLRLATSVALAEPASDIAFGDLDGDGDQDLFVAGHGDRIRVYGDYRDGTLDVIWTSEDWHNVCALATGDFDGDGNDDLAVGGCDEPTFVYRSYGEGLYPEWSSDLAEHTESVAWADHDGDGDLDLGVGNEGQPLRVYANRGEWFDLAWSSDEPVVAGSVAWADHDGDGDPDLAVGVRDGEPVLLYRNDLEEGEGGGNGGPYDGGNDAARFELSQTAQEGADIRAIAWSDVDGDGDPDLAVGNDGAPTRLYRNDGGTLTPAWSSDELEPTRDVEWASWVGGPDPCALAD